MIETRIAVYGERADFSCPACAAPHRIVTLTDEHLSFYGEIGTAEPCKACGHTNIFNINANIKMGYSPVYEEAAPYSSPPKTAREVKDEEKADVELPIGFSGEWLTSTASSGYTFSDPPEFFDRIEEKEGSDDINDLF